MTVIGRRTLRVRDRWLCPIRDPRSAARRRSHRRSRNTREDANPDRRRPKPDKRILNQENTQRNPRPLHPTTNRPARPTTHVPRANPPRHRRSQPETRATSPQRRQMPHIRRPHRRAQRTSSPPPRLAANGTSRPANRRPMRRRAAPHPPRRKQHQGDEYNRNERPRNQTRPKPISQPPTEHAASPTQTSNNDRPQNPDRSKRLTPYSCQPSDRYPSTLTRNHASAPSPPPARPHASKPLQVDQGLRPKLGARRACGLHDLS